MAETNAQREPSVSVHEAPSPLQLKAFDPGLADRWDRFVLGHPKGTFFHQTGWMRAVQKTFGHRPLYFYTERDGKITGIAPFFRISNWLAGRCIISVPLAAYGGICAEDDESENVLLKHAKELAVSERADYLELRHRNGGLVEGFHPNHLYVSFQTELAPDPEANRKRLPKDTRYMIRKAEKGGLSVETGTDKMRDFYGVFAQSMRRLGTPAFPMKLFQNLVEEFPKHSHLLLIRNGAQPVAGVLSFFFRDTILPYYSGASPDAPRLAANNLMYWELMKWAAGAGFRWFDFGRSKRGTGAFAFKTQWNMEMETLDYQVYLVRRKTPPNFSPLNPKFGLAIRAWKRLPLPVTTWLGPQVARWFP